jgi:hypothetical protein
MRDVTAFKILRPIMRDVTAFKILRPIYCSYYAYFKIMVIKHTEETNSFTAAWKFCVVEQHVKLHGRQKRTTIRGNKFIPSPFWRPKDGNFIAIYKKKSFGFCASNMEKWPSNYQMDNTDAQPVQEMVNNEHETNDHMQHCLDSRLSLLGITSRHRFSLVSLGPRANAEMVPAFPSCLCMLLM